MRQTRKCEECESPTYYTNIDGTPSPTCQNCTLLLEVFRAAVRAINLHQPLTGKRRHLEILKYRITVAED